MRGRHLIVVAVAAAWLALASPANAAWGRTTNYGSPGFVGGIDWRGAEGGICGGPGVTVTCPFSTDQIFVNRYRAYTAPYAVAQTISSTAYAYWYDASTTSWRLLATHSEGACRWLAGNGGASCGPFGS